MNSNDNFDNLDDFGSEWEEQLLAEVSKCCNDDPVTLDDHYESEINNNSLRLSGTEFDLQLSGLIKELGNKSDKEFYEKIYRLLMNQSNKWPIPDEPNDNQLICRYLTPTKFLWFVTQKAIRFCTSEQFDDPYDCSIPKDYNHHVQARIAGKRNLPDKWEKHILNASREWLISCWTCVGNSRNDDHLIWYKYAGGPTGVGLTIRYDELKKFLLENIKSANLNVSLKTGLVNYDESSLRLLPFNKRSLFRNEKEVRFAFSPVEIIRDHTVDVSSIFDKFGLRFSDDVPEYHCEALKKIWENCGGNARYTGC